MKRLFGITVVLCTIAASLLLGGPSQAQAPASSMSFVFSGNATVSPGIFLPLRDPTSNTSWRWGLPESAILACQGAGRSNGAPTAGSCILAGGGPLLPDLPVFTQPHCGNSRGASVPGSARFQDPSGRVWTGELHWDGVLTGDPSYSLGSQLLLFGRVSSSGAGTAEVILFLNATGGSNCDPLVSPGGATGFTVNGVGVLRSL